MLDGMKYVFRDWHLKAVGSGEIKNGVLDVPNDKPIFCIDLTR
jgi:hypothetical protein